jgi:hypothetical protein
MVFGIVGSCLFTKLRRRRLRVPMCSRHLTEGAFMKPDKVIQLVTQAERARRIASECGSQLIADLFEVHAQLCERNAWLLQQRGRQSDHA